MLGIDEGGEAAPALGLGHHVVQQRGLAGGLRAKDLNDTALGQPTDAEGNIKRQRTGGDVIDVCQGHVPHPHDRALAELLLDLRDCRVQCL